MKSKCCELLRKMNNTVILGRKAAASNVGHDNVVIGSKADLPVHTSNSTSVKSGAVPPLRSR